MNYNVIRYYKYLPEGIFKKERMLMDIGGKIKNARTQAGLTQEQSAQALGVSRQTISNWENEKTYPDIVSVVKMSDLYHVSLDYLLKGDTQMSDYMNYLEESTNTVKSRNNLSMLILTAVCLGIWTFSLIAFWFFISGSDAMGYSLMFLWVLLPVTIFAASFIIGKNDYLPKYKWLPAVISGIMYMLAEYATFSASNMIAFNKINMPEWGMLVSGAIISLIGTGIGAAVKTFSKRRRNSSEI